MFADQVAVKEMNVLTFEQISELIELVAKNQMSGVEIERSGFRLKIEGRQVVSAPTVVAAPAAPVATVLADAPVVAAPEAAPAAAVEEAPAYDHVLNSPIVGTFYRSPNPDSAPFVEKGDRVKKGQVLCIIEAMKLMNEIESDADGIIVEVFPKNAQPVEYGEALFAIQTD